MAVTGQFGDVSFGFTDSRAVLFADLKYSADCETEDQTQNGQKFAAYKEGKAAQITMTILLKSMLGVDVRETVQKLMHWAQRGQAEYLYIGGEKAFPFKVMLTKADADEITFSPGMKWLSAKVSVTFRQAAAEWILTDPAAASGGTAAGGGEDDWSGYTEEIRPETRVPEIRLTGTQLSLTALTPEEAVRQVAEFTRTAGRTLSMIMSGRSVSTGTAGTPSLPASTSAAAQTAATGSGSAAGRVHLALGQRR